MNEEENLNWKVAVCVVNRGLPLAWIPTNSSSFLYFTKKLNDYYNVMPWKKKEILQFKCIKDSPYQTGLYRCPLACARVLSPLVWKIEWFKRDLVDYNFSSFSDGVLLFWLKNAFSLSNHLSFMFVFSSMVQYQLRVTSKRALAHNSKPWTWTKFKEHLIIIKHLIESLRSARNGEKKDIERNWRKKVPSQALTRATLHIANVLYWCLLMQCIQNYIEIFSIFLVHILVMLLINGVYTSIAGFQSQN